jgi:FAD dependent oxidoreductase TIGR03364
MSERFDVAVVGAGIVGLATAYHLAKRGQRVIVFERSARAMGASVRNFGMLWPIGQPAGPMHRIALRSREIWLEVLRDSGLWHEQTGSLHLAYRDDEAQVLSEFVRDASAKGFDCALLDPSQVIARSPAVKSEELKAGLWSPTEICVDPRRIIGGLPDYLTRTYGVRFEFGCAVTGYAHPHVFAAGAEWEADQLYVCSGDDLQTLYPEVFQGLGLFRCKLQMMRSQPYGASFQLGPMLAAGLTLRHYKSFQDCPSLPALKQRFTAQMPEYERYGIHVMASQNGHGEVTLGDSHEYAEQIEPFDKPEIDALVLDYLATFLDVPGLRIASRWHGIYVKHATESFFILHPSAPVTIVTGVGGAGMTLSFGVTEQAVSSA